MKKKEGTCLERDALFLPDEKPVGNKERKKEICNMPG